MSRKLLKIGILIIALIMGYILGQYVPIGLFKPEYKEEIIGKAEYTRLVISVISATITFLAVVVALFKDDIREYWKRPIIQFCMPDVVTVEVFGSSESESQGDTLIATGYISRIEVKNTGNLPALNAEIYLDKLSFIPKDSEIVQSIESSSSALEWNGADSMTIIIPPGGKKILDIVQILPPEKISTPDSAKSSKPSSIFIGNIENLKEHTKGKWEATFSLYAQNHKPTSFTIVVEWNGIWKTRLTEFSNYYAISQK